MVTGTKDSQDKRDRDRKTALLIAALTSVNWVFIAWLMYKMVHWELGLSLLVAMFFLMLMVIDLELVEIRERLERKEK